MLRRRGHPHSHSSCFTPEAGTAAGDLSGCQPLGLRPASQVGLPGPTIHPTARGHDPCTERGHNSAMGRGGRRRPPQQFGPAHEGQGGPLPQAQHATTRCFRLGGQQRDVRLGYPGSQLGSAAIALYIYGTRRTDEASDAKESPSSRRPVISHSVRNTRDQFVCRAIEPTAFLPCAFVFCPFVSNDLYSLAWSIKVAKRCLVMNWLRYILHSLRTLSRGSTTGSSINKNSHTKGHVSH